MDSSILFDEDPAPKKKGKSKKSGLFSQPSSGFSKSKDVGSTHSLNLFEDEEITAKPKKNSEPKIMKKSSSSEEMTSKDANAIVEEFLVEHPEIIPFIRISDFTEIGLSPAQVRQKIADIASDGFVKIKQCSPIILKISDQIEQATKNVQHKYRKREINENNMSIERRGLYDLAYSLRMDKIELQKKNLDKVSDAILFIGNLVNIFISKNVGRELKILVPKIESALTEFEDSDPLSVRYTHAIQYVDNRLSEKEKEYEISFSRILSLCKEGFSEQTGYFPMNEAQTLFETSLESDSSETESLEKRINVALQNPKAIGKAVLTQANDYMKRHDASQDSLQFVFILMARYFFSRFYVKGLWKTISQTDCSEFTSRILQLRKLSPIGFGFSGNFIREKYRSVPLYAFPSDNPYAEAVSFFGSLQFQTCPLDFCKAGHDALKTIQQIASETSFNMKKDRTGKVFAKSDHLLCLDDLFDISLIVLLLAAPVGLKAMVDAFEPFVEPLEMTAELEFAFTNISAMVRHICDLDLDAFVAEAKKRTEQAMEIDPLNIM